MTALAMDPSLDSLDPPVDRQRLLSAARRVGWVAMMAGTVTAATLFGMALSVLFAIGTVIVGAIALVCVVVVAAVIAALALVFAARLVAGAALALVVAALAAALGITLAFGAGLWHGGRSLWRMLERLGRNPRYASASSSGSRRKIPSSLKGIAAPNRDRLGFSAVIDPQVESIVARRIPRTLVTSRDR